MTVRDCAGLGGQICCVLKQEGWMGEKKSMRKRHTTWLKYDVIFNDAKKCFIIEDVKD